MLSYRTKYIKVRFTWHIFDDLSSQTNGTFDSLQSFIIGCVHARCPAVRVFVTSVKEMRFIYWLIYIKEYDKGGNNVLLIYKLGYS